MTASLIHALPWMAALLALAGTAAEDLRVRLIPDSYPAFIALCGLAMALATGAGELGIGILAALCAGVALGTLAHYGVMGGGDVKLIAAVCLLVPPGSIPIILAEIALAGGLLSSVYLAGGLLLRRQPVLYRWPAGTVPASPFRKWLRLEGARIAKGCPVPYALAVLGGAAVHFMRELPPCFSAMSCSL